MASYLPYFTLVANTVFIWHIVGAQEVFWEWIRMAKPGHSSKVRWEDTRTSRCSNPKIWVSRSTEKRLQWPHGYGWFLWKKDWLCKRQLTKKQCGGSVGNGKRFLMSPHHMFLWAALRALICWFGGHRSIKRKGSQRMLKGPANADPEPPQ